MFVLLFFISVLFCDEREEGKKKFCWYKNKHSISCNDNYSNDNWEQSVKQNSEWVIKDILKEWESSEGMIKRFKLLHLQKQFFPSEVREDGNENEVREVQCAKHSSPIVSTQWIVSSNVIDLSFWQW